MTTDTFKPILFSTEMVQAILAGRKTQTRRVIKPQPTHWVSDSNRDVNPVPCILEKHGLRQSISQPLYEDDILWVRETFDKVTWEFLYKADDNSDHDFISAVKWKPSIFMPKEAARIFLNVTNVRVERLQDISEEDAIAEGVYSLGETKQYNWKYYKNYNKSQDYTFMSPIDSFESLWQSINAKKHPWDSNPWVWVYEFELIKKPVNFLP